MALEITGKVLQLLPEQSGTGKNGTAWVRRDFVIETTNDQYPKKICFSVLGEKVSMVNGLQPGQTVKVSFNPESREYNGKWYSDLRAWKIEPEGVAAGGGDYARNQPSPEAFLPSSASNDENDLPF